MRIHRLGRATLPLFAGVLACAGCTEIHLDDAGPDARVPTDTGTRDGGLPPPPPTRDVDWLIVMDNSGSMAEEQASFTAELPRMISILASGDFDQDGDLVWDGEPGDEDFVPIESLHVGVVTADMGTGGFAVPTCARSDFGDDAILRTQGRTDIPGCMETYPPFLSFGLGGSGSPEDFARDIACVATTGTGGCGFEQQLEAALKAVSPSAPMGYTAPGYVAPIFFRNSFGQGDTNNAGFLRDDSILAVLVISDEEDCSARDPELFNPSSATYGATELNLRCFAYEDQAVHPIERYVDGLLQVRRHPSRLAFGVVAGVPTALIVGPGQPIDWERMVSDDPAVRDDRMEVRIDPYNPSRLVPSCNVPGIGVAFAPIRILRTARAIEARGGRVSVGSICQISYTEVIANFVRELAE